jgi:putative inorganic carbon (HCO3(-)) transporter
MRSAPVTTRRFRRNEASLPASTSSLEGRVFDLDLRAITRVFLRQSIGFWFIWLYVLFEYVRPQTIYSFIDFFPWAQAFIVGAVVLAVVENRLQLQGAFLWITFAVFSLVVVLSSFSALAPAASWAKFSDWVNWMLLILVVGGAIRTRSELFLLVFGFCLWNLKMSQHGFRSWASAGFQFRNWGVTGAPGWFQNSGEFGIEMCIFLPLVGYLAYAMWPKLSRIKQAAMVLVVCSAFISVIGSSSRGALLGVGAVGIWLLLRSPQRLKGLAIIGALSAIAFLLLPPESLDRFRDMGTDKTSLSRITYWKDGLEIASQYPLLGIGFNNWISYYRANYNPVGELPHNFLIECVAELGYLGLVALLAVLIAFFFNNAVIRKHTRIGAAGADRFAWSLALGLDGAMIGFIVSGSFVTVLFYPYIWMNVALSLALGRVAIRSRPASMRLGRRVSTAP